jgi:hypothetical protein
VRLRSQGDGARRDLHLDHHRDPLVSRGRLEGQAGLATPGGTDDGDRTLMGEQRLQRSELLATTHEGVLGHLDHRPPPVPGRGDQPGATVHTELAAQGRAVALDGADRDGQLLSRSPCSSAPRSIAWSTSTSRDDSSSDPAAVATRRPV